MWHVTFMGMHSLNRVHIGAGSLMSNPSFWQKHSISCLQGLWNIQWLISIWKYQGLLPLSGHVQSSLSLFQFYLKKATNNSVLERFHDSTEKAQILGWSKGFLLLPGSNFLILCPSPPQAPHLLFHWGILYPWPTWAMAEQDIGCSGKRGCLFETTGSCL